MLATLFGLLRKGQRGQMLVLAAFTIAIAVAATGLAIDVGLMMHTRTELQKDVDAMALAGAQALCGQASCDNQADTYARQYGTENNVKGADQVVIDFTTDCDGAARNKHDQVTVRLKRYRSSIFARIVGFNGTDIPACATARKMSVGSTMGVRPFGVEEQCIRNIPYGGMVTLKYDAGLSTRNCDASTGNFGPIRIDGQGGDTYKNTIINGSINSICAEEDPACTYPYVDTETGNKMGPTEVGVDYLIDNVNPSCDTWGEVAGPGATVTTQCNPWKPTYQGGTRVIIIPVVEGLWSAGGQHTITIKRFAVVFLEEISSGCGQGNDCEIRGRFMKSIVTIEGATGMDLTPDEALTMVQLVK